jgi:hypothetical protein
VRAGVVHPQMEFNNNVSVSTLEKDIGHGGTFHCPWCGPF